MPASIRCIKCSQMSRHNQLKLKRFFFFFWWNVEWIRWREWGRRRGGREGKRKALFLLLQVLTGTKGAETVPRPSGGYAQSHSPSSTPLETRLSMCQSGIHFPPSLSLSRSFHLSEFQMWDFRALASVVCSCIISPSLEQETACPEDFKFSTHAACSGVCSCFFFFF